MRKRLYLNSLSGGLQLLLSSLVIFIALPLMIKKLGTELYGVFSLLLLLGNLNAFINLGLNTTLIKFLAEQGKTSESDKDIFVSVTLLLILLIPITMLCFLYSDFILLEILKIPTKYFNSLTRNIYYFLLLSNILILLGQLASAILDSMQMIYLVNILQTIYNLLYWGLILISFYVFDNLEGIGWSIFLAAVFWFISVTYFALKSWGKFGLRGLRKDFYKCSKKQLSYSIKLYSSGIISFFFEPLSKILVSQFIGVKEVGFLDIALRFRTMIWNFITKILYPIFPYISSINEKLRLRNFIHDIEQKLAYMIVPVLATIIFITYPFINLWLGKDAKILSWSIIPITSAYMFAIVVVPVYQYFQAKGHPGKTVLMQIVNVLINGSVFFLCYKSFGYYAIIIANVAAISSSFLMCLYFQKLYFNSLIFDSIKQLKYFFLILITLILIGYIFNNLISSDYVKVLFFPLLFGSLSIFLFRIFYIFTSNDVQKYFGNSILKKIISKLILVK